MMEGGRRRRQAFEDAVKKLPAVGMEGEREGRRQDERCEILGWRRSAGGVGEKYRSRGKLLGLHFALTGGAERAHSTLYSGVIPPLARRVACIMAPELTVTCLELTLFYNSTKD